MPDHLAGLKARTGVRSIHTEGELHAVLRQEYALLLFYASWSWGDEKAAELATAWEQELLPACGLFVSEIHLLDTWPFANDWVYDHPRLQVRNEFGALTC